MYLKLIKIHLHFDIFQTVENTHVQISLRPSNYYKLNQESIQIENMQPRIRRLTNHKNNTTNTFASRQYTNPIKTNLYENHS